MDRLIKGSVEYYPVEITDNLGNITTLDGSNPMFNLYSVDEDGEETQIVTDEPMVWDDDNEMIALPLIDLSGPSIVIGLHKLELIFSFPPETPMVGPYYFEVID